MGRQLRICIMQTVKLSFSVLGTLAEMSETTILQLLINPANVVKNKLRESYRPKSTQTFADLEMGFILQESSHSFLNKRNQVKLDSWSHENAH